RSDDASGGGAKGWFVMRLPEARLVHTLARTVSTPARPASSLVCGAVFALLLQPCGGRAAEENPYAPDRAEPGSVEKIREFTTAPEFLPESVSYVPASDSVPSPTKVLGHLVGAPGELSHVAPVHAYFEPLP